MNKMFMYLVVAISMLSLLAGACAKPAPTTTAPKPAPTTAASTSTPTPKPTPATTTAPLKQIVLKFSHNLPPTHTNQVETWEPWAKEVTEKTGGRVKIEFYPAGALGTYAEHYELARKGAADIAYIVETYTPGIFNLNTVTTLPLAIPTALDGVKIRLELFNKSEAIRKEFADVVVLMFGSGSSGTLMTTKKQVKVLEDAKGLKIRSPGGNQTPALGALGMVPVTIDAAELYMALDRGTVDGAIFDYGNGINRKFQEVVKYTTEAGGLGLTNVVAIMNKDAFNSLPEDVKKLMLDLRDKYSIKWGEGQQKAELAGRGIFEKAGTSIYVLPPTEKERWAKAVKPVWDSWVQTMKGKGLPADEIMQLFLSAVKNQGIKLPF